MITIDLSTDSCIFHEIDIKKNILKDITMYGVNVVVCGKDTEKIYRTINDMVSEIPLLDRSIFCDRKIKIPKNGVTLEDIKARMSSDDLILEAFKFTPDRVVVGVVNDSVQMNLLFLYLSEGYSSVILGLPMKDGENISEAAQSLLYEVKGSVEFKEAPDVLLKFLLDNIHIGVKVD